MADGVCHSFKKLSVERHPDYCRQAARPRTITVNGGNTNRSRDTVIGISTFSLSIMRDGTGRPSHSGDRAMRSYTIDLIWQQVPPGPIKNSIPPFCVWPVAGGGHFGKMPFFPAIVDEEGKPDFNHPLFDEYPRRVLADEVLRSPYEPRGFEPLWRPNKDAKQWAAVTPERQPGAWALRHVEAPANALSAKRKRLAPLRRLMRERLPDHDDLDRLATSAAIEAE